jgi:flagellar basal body rod protein FlgG
MNRGIYATATGMIAGQKLLDTISHNLANVSTNGFKRDDVAFGDAFVRQLRSRGHQIGSLGAGATLMSEFTIFSQGQITPTGNPLDVALNDEKSAFAVQTPQGTRYTRDGAFMLDAQRRLVTKSGNPVLDDGGNPIELPQGQIQISASGQVEVDGQEVAKLGVFEGKFRKVGGNLFESADAKPNDEYLLSPGAVEGSNVNAIEAMVSMIAVSRAFEMAQKSITEQDELTQRLIGSLQA